MLSGDPAEQLQSSDSSRDGRTGRKWPATLGVGLAALALGALAGWAITVVFVPPPGVLDDEGYTYVEAVEGEVGSSITLKAVAEWTLTPIGSNLATGTVTSVIVQPGEEVSTGTALYTVNLRPVVIAQGAVPAFRPLVNGSRGEDVVQLQTMLKNLGLYAGDVDGRYGPGTAEAVRRWQKSLGVPADGVVQAGDIVFVPALPSRVALDTTVISRGSLVSGGEEVVSGLADAPSFALPITSTQAQLASIGTRVEIDGPTGELWEAFVEAQTVGSDQAIVAILVGADGTPPCQEACQSIPVTTQTLLTSRVVTVETVSGVVVPTAAVISRADGSLAVINEAGQQKEVSIVESARGMSVVEGIPIGTRVRIPASTG